MKLTDAGRGRRRARKARSEGGLTQRRRDGEPARRVEPLEDRVLLATDLRLISVLRPDGSPLNDGAKLAVAPSELTFVFDEGQSIDPGTLGAIQLTASGQDGSFGEPNDVAIAPGFLGLTSRANEVVMRFAERLVDDVYQILIDGAGAAPLMNTDGDVFNDATDVTRTFELDLGAQVVAVAPQPLQRDAAGNLVQDSSQIVVYFNNDDLDPTSAETASFYQLIDTKGTESPLDDTLTNPTTVSYDADSDTAVLDFGAPLAARTYRLRIGNDEALPVAPLATGVAADSFGAETHSSFDSAFNLGTVGTAPRIISSSIDAQSFGPSLPGSINEPGHRDIEISVPGESHLNAGADATTGITTGFYNFRDVYGVDPQGNTLHNVITEAQKQRAREIFEIYGHYLGIEFIETASSGLTVITGDLRAISPTIPTGPGGVAGISEGSLFGRVIMDAAENWGNSEYGGGWFQTAMHEIGHSMGLGHTYDQPSLTIMGDFGGGGERVFPGDNDLVHGLFRFRPESKDIDLYRFEVLQAGVLTAETVAERLSRPEFGGGDASLLNSLLTLYEEFQVLEVPANGGADLADGQTFTVDDGTNVATFEFDVGNGVGAGNVAINFNKSDAPSRLARTIFAALTGAEAGLELQASVVGRRLELRGMVQVANSSGLDSFVSRNIIARNDDYFSSDSLVRLPVTPGVYYVAVTSTGNTDFDPTIRDSGFGGTTQGAYELNVEFHADPSASMVDATGTMVDGDLDGEPGGAFDFWFRAGNTIFVDKANDLDPTVVEGNGSLADPYDNIASALAAAQAGDIVRIAGNDDNLPYLVGVDDLGRSLSDGKEMLVPRGVTVMVEAGAVIKMRRANIDVGTSAPEENRSEGALQLLGTPVNQVLVTSYRNDAIGGDSDGASVGPRAGDWGGLVYRDDSDREDDGIFLNYVANTDLSFGGGEVLVNSVRRVFSPIHLVASRPTILRNTITNTGQNADAAISADPESFEETRFAGYDRVGPDIDGNFLANNSINGVFVRILTPFSSGVNKLEVSARFNDKDVVHVVGESLFLAGTPGGPELVGGVRMAREDGRLAVDPGVIVKLLGARIEAEIGAQLIAEGEPGREAIFTSLRDDRYGAGGTFDTNRDGAATTPARGDWGGLFFGAASQGNLDYATVLFAGGVTPIEGGFEQFNPIEIHQADVRIANSTIAQTADGASAPGQTAPNRNGRGGNAQATIFVRGAQPIIVGNAFRDNVGATIHINANSLNADRVPDTGRTTGRWETMTVFGDDLHRTEDNRGPLVRFNRIDNDPANDAINGMLIRGGVLTTESIWDDPDMVHVLFDEIVSLNEHSVGGLRLQSSHDASLVVKLLGSGAGFTADGTPLEIDDRIGGTVQVVGTPEWPVILTTVNDCNVGAGLTAAGDPQTDTANTGACSGASVGNSGAVVIDGGDRDDFGHGFADPGPDGALGTADDINMDGWQFIQQMVEFALAGSRNNAPNDLLVIGADVPSQAADAITSVATVLGLVPTFVNDAAISTIPFTDYKVIYVPSDDLDTFGGIGTGFFGGVDELGLLAQRKTDIQNFVNTGGSLVALTEDALSPNGYPWLELPLPFQTASVFFGIQPLRKTQAAINAGFTITDIELSNGVPYHNEFTGPPGFNGLQPFVLDTGPDGIPDNADDRVITLGLASGSFGIGISGPWRSIRLDKFSNDRNVAIVNERESSFTLGVDENAIPDDAQFLGDLARNEKSGDENLRLGFEVHGSISFDDRGDVDVYSFTGEAGTEVWFDIDRTAGSLDTVLELVDVNGNVLARSTTNASLQSFLVEARPMLKDPFVDNDLGGANPGDAFDLYTTNPRDPGMRVVLPGPIPGERQEYFIRVRSNTPNAADLDDPAELHSGTTRGAYQLQVRLRQVDEHPGSTVVGADIGFATNGVEVIGLPAHSPLTGESADEPTDGTNEGFGAAQPLGNLLTVDRNTLSVGGVLASSTDVDWYSFEVNYDLIQAIGGFNAGFKSFATLFDLDYADGLSRADTTIAVFDQAGNLILLGTDSDILEDQPGPTEGADTDDLSRGTFGKLDPYIGTAQLPAGVVPAGSSQTYTVAVFSNALLPAVLDQLMTAGATSPLARLEPANTSQRIVEDHIGFVGYNSGLDALVPVLPKGSLFSGNTAQELATHAVSFNLGDVVLYVTSGGDLFTVDPLTGATETDVTGPNANLTNILGDIAMRPDAFLYGINTSIRNQAINDANTGNYILLDSGSGAETTAGDDGIPTNPDIGSRFQALTFRQNSVGNFDAFAVNNIADPDPTTIEHALWRLDPNSGAAIDENPNANGLQPFRALPQNLIITGLAFSSPTGGALFGVGPNGTLYNMFSLNPIRTNVTGVGAGFTGLTLGPQNVENGAFANMLFATATNGRMYAFDFAGNLQTIFDTTGDGMADSTSVPLSVGQTTGLAFSTVDFNLWHPTLQRRDDPGHGIAASFDNSRNDLAEAEFTIGGQTVNQSEGGASFYFGLENPNDPVRERTLVGQPAANNYSATNAALYDTYGPPGGAHGSLITDPFSLEGYAETDYPTLYFTYFLDTEGANSSTNGMRDSFRVQVSNDGGQTWNMLATNNSVRSIFFGESELPAFASLSADAASDSRQRIQELFDSTGSWRQARVDLRDFVGDDNLILRFDFSTSGVIGGGLPGDSFGDFGNRERGQNNAFEGAYIDDIVIGFAERGEMATAAGAQTAFFNVPQDPRPNAPSQILTGPYQLEVRRGTEFATNNNSNDADVFVFRTFDTNDRLTDAFTIFAPPGASVVDGQAFALTDGVHTITFEFESGGGVSPGLVVPIFFNGNETAAQLADQIAAAINSVNTRFPSLVPPFNVRAASIASSNKIEIIGATETLPLGSGLNLTATAAVNSIWEPGGPGSSSTTVTVRREGSTAAALNFTLFAIDPTTGGPTDEVALGGGGSTTFIGTIPAGSSSLAIAVDALDDFLPDGTPLADGTQPVLLRAVASGFQSVTDILNVRDNEVAALTVEIVGSDSVAEPATSQGPSTGEPFVWELRQPLLDPRTATGVEGASASLIGDQIYVSHGFRGTDSALFSIYDIPSDTWTHGGPSAPDASVIRSEMAGGTALGRHYAIGGRTGPNAEVEEFDPASGLWSTKAPMNAARGGLGAASWNDMIYAVGGRTGGSFGTAPILDVNEVYDPVADSWTLLAPMPTPVSDNYATVALDGKVYVFGGATGLTTVIGDVQIYDIASDTWSTGTPMPTPRAAAMAGVLGGQIAVFGGYDGTSNLVVTEIYNPATDSWSPGPDMLMAVSEVAQGITSDGKQVFSIGSGIFGPSLSTVQVLIDQRVDVLQVGTHSTEWNDGSFSVTKIDIGAFATQDLSGFDAIYVDASARSSAADLNILLNRAADISAFVAAGGGLLTDNGGDFGDPDFSWVPNAAGLTWVTDDDDNIQITALGQGHPVTGGLNSAGLSNWGTSQHSAFTATAGMDVLATDSLGQADTLAGDFGQGRLVYFGIDPSYHQDTGADPGAPEGQSRELIRQAISWAAGFGVAPAFVAGQVMRNTPTDEPLEVFLASMDPSEAIVPPSVVIPAGSSSTSFAVIAVNDNLLDGDQTVAIHAFASGFRTGIDTVTVTDSVSLELSVTVDADSIVENDGLSAATGTVTREGDTSAPLVVLLEAIDPFSASFTDELVLRSGVVSGASISVTIPAGSASAPFLIDAVDDLLTDGTQAVMVTASAAGFTALVDVVDVQDDEDVTITMPPLMAGTNVNVSRSSFNQAEVTIAANPANPLNLIASANNLDATATEDLIWYSTNGGQSWTVSPIPNTAGSIAGGDPTVVFDRAGNAYFAHLTIPGIAVAKSTDGGQTWTAVDIPVPVGFADKEFLSVGPDVGDPTQDRIYIGYHVGNVQYINSSPDGVAWSAPVQVSDAGNSGINAQMAVDANGVVYMAWQGLFQTPGFSDVVVDVSSDGGLTWGIDTVAYTTNVAAFNDPVTGGQYTVPAAPVRGMGAFLAMEADRSGGPNDGNLYVLVLDQGDLDGDPLTGHDDTDVFVIRSTDGGSTWSSPVRVNDDTTTNSQFVPWLDVDQTTGNVGVAWYDARNDDGSGGSGDTDGIANNDVQYFASASLDGAQSFLPNVQVSEGTSSAAALPDNPFPFVPRFDYGEYPGLAFRENTLHALWADNSNSTGDNPDGTLSYQDLYYASVSLVTTPMLRTTIAADAIDEVGGTTTATVERFTDDLSASQTVTLISSDPTEATLNGTGLSRITVIIPAGQQSASYTIEAVDEFKSDGPKTVTIFAAAPGFETGVDTLSVADDDLRLAVSDNVNMSDAFGNMHGEISIAVNPDNPLRLVATAVSDPEVDTAANVLTSSTDRVWFSADGGRTWQHSTPANLPGAADAGDPSVVYDSNGIVYFAHRDFNFGIVVHRSLNNGQTWGPGTIVPLADPANDPGNLTSPYLAVGPDASNPAQDRLYVGYHVSGVARINSSLNGLAWQPTDTVVSATGNGTGAQIGVGSAGELFYVWENFASTGVGNVILNTSLDGGLTWGPDLVIYTSNVNVVNDAFTPGGGLVGLDGIDERTNTDGLGDYEIPAQPEWGISTRPSIAVDRSGSANDGTIYVALTDQGDLDGDPDRLSASDHHDTDVFVIRSTDGGATWSSPVRVNDDVTLSSQFLPWLAVDQDTGNVAVAWYDGHDDVNNDEVAVYASVSLDGGASFQPSVRVAEELSGQTVIDPSGQVSTTDAFDFGDYLGLDFDNGFLHVAWADNGGLLGTGPQNQDVFYSTVALVSEDLTVRVEIDADAIAEAGGTTTATITRSGGDLTQPLFVDLEAIDPTAGIDPLTGQVILTDELRFRASGSQTHTVVIPAMQTSVTVFLDAINDFLADGTQPVLITPSGFPHDPISDSVDVLDDETPTLTVTVNPTVIDENDGPQAATGTVTRNTPTDEDLVVFLISSDPSEATVPQTVVIPAGQASATFPISAVDELISDGVRSVTIFAAARGFITGEDSLNVNPTSNLVSFERLGDENLQREQGHILIESNIFRTVGEFAVVVDAGTRTSGDNRTHGGPVLNVPTPNNARLVPGVTIENNLIVGFGTGGIRFSGDPNASGPLAPATFGHIAHNTIFGGAIPAGTGIVIENNASPTLLNNLLSSVQRGITIDASSRNLPSPPIVGTTLYHAIPAGQETDFGNLGSFSIVLAATDPLFVNSGQGNFYLADGVAAIDSSLNALVDRTEFVVVKDPLGIPPTPMLTPDRDVFGQMRVDDPTQDPPPGLGSNIFKDRGAVERADFVGPRAILIDPADDPTALALVATSPDLQPLPNEVVVNASFPLKAFTIQLLDGEGGSGIDDLSVESQRFTLLRDSQVLTEGVDYSFRYNPFRDTVELISPDAAYGTGEYIIQLHADGNMSDRITDIGGNKLEFPNPYEFKVVIDTVPPQATVVAPLDGGPDDVDPAIDVVVVDTAQSAIVIRVLDPQGGLDHDTIALGATPNIPVFALEMTQDLAPRGGAPIRNLVLDTDYTFNYSIVSPFEGTITLTPTAGGVLGGSFSDALYTIRLGDGMPGGLKDITDLAENILANTTLVVNVREVGAAIIESGGSTDVDEEGPTSDTYDIVLESEPTDDVVVTISFDGAQVAVNGNTSGSTQVVFTTADWNVPQTVTVTAVDDLVPESDPHTTVLTHSITSTDVLYDALPIVGDPVTVTIAENDDPVSITGVKFEDLNGDGVNDPGEPLLAGWTIFLDLNNNGSLDAGDISTVTAGDGSYSLRPPTIGTFTVAEVLQAGWFQTAPAAGTHTVVVSTAGQVISDNDFGNFRVATIAGRKFEDLNRNGAQDAGETGLPGWTIFLDNNGNGLPDAGEISTVTDAAGNYQITDLGPGTYFVDEAIQPGWVQTFPASGRHTVTVNVSGATFTGIDFGNFEELSFGPEFGVNSIEAGAQRFSSIAMAPDGSFVAAWSGPDGSDFGIFARRFNAFGQPLGPDFRVNTFTTDRQWLPSVAVDALGRFAVTWTSFKQDGTPRSVYMRRFAADGTPQGGETRVNTMNTGFQTNSTVAMDAAGNITIVWTSFANTTVAGDVFARRFAADGSSLGDQFQVNTFTTAGQGDSAIATDPDGNTVFIWTSFTQDGSDGGVFGQRYDPNGQPVGGEFQINEFAAGRQSEPTVAMDPGGGFVVGWTSIDQDGSGRGVFARPYDALGQPRDGVIQVNSFVAGDQRDSAVATDAHGNFTFVWTGAGQDGSGNGVFAQRFDPVGNRVGDEFRVNAITPGDQDEPAIAMDPNGNFAVTWTGFDSGDRGIRGRQFSVVDSPTPEVTVFADGTKLVDDEPTPVDFGTGFVGLAGPTQTFTVRNDGTVPLTTSSLVVPAGFLLVEGLASSVNPGQADTFTIALDTATDGAKGGEIRFVTDDADENPFNIQVSGLVEISDPEITVLLSGVEIADGSTTPIDFGTVTEGDPGPELVFTVRNDGAGPLSLSGLVVPAGFTVLEGLSATLDPSASDTFRVRLDTDAAGTPSGDVSFANNDADENPFNFAVTGTVNAMAAPAPAPEITVLYEGATFGSTAQAPITDGSTTPIDLGTVTDGAPAVEHLFRVRNDGNADLMLNPVVLPTGFVLVDPLVNMLGAGESDMFSIMLDEKMPGDHSGSVALGNNDLDEDPFDFMISGSVESAATDPHMPLLFRKGMWYYDLDGNGGKAEKSFAFGIGSDVPVTGDWNNDGFDEAGIFRDGVWYLDVDGAGGKAEKKFAFGIPGDVPFAGDFNGDGNTDVGVFRSGKWYIDLDGAGGKAEKAFAFGIGGDRPVTGDFNGDGTTDAGIFRNGMWYLDLNGAGGKGEKAFPFGIGSDVPVVGDFNGDGTSDAGVFRNGMWYLDLNNSGGAAEASLHFGIGGDLPLAARQAVGSLLNSASIAGATTSRFSAVSTPAATSLSSTDESAGHGDDPVGAALDELLGGGTAPATSPSEPVAGTDEATLELISDEPSTNEQDARAELLGEVLDEALIVGL